MSGSRPILLLIEEVLMKIVEKRTEQQLRERDLILQEQLKYLPDYVRLREEFKRDEERREHREQLKREEEYDAAERAILERYGEKMRDPDFADRITKDYKEIAEERDRRERELRDRLDPPSDARKDFDESEEDLIEPKKRRDPLILDLDGDGIETTDLSNGGHFDHDKNGLAELSSWVGKDDGLLVFDRNGDTIINDGGELFGDQTVLGNSGYTIHN
jgi:hypothetical protein